MISIADDVFAEIDEDDERYDGYGSTNESIMLTGTFDRATADAALRAAGNRFMMVDETGVEHRDAASLESAAERDLYSPNYVSEPERTEHGIELYVDCKGGIDAPIRAAFLRILVEELEGAGLTDVSVATPPLRD